jgi:prepilin-type processing-associated H-X9-DG protein
MYADDNDNVWAPTADATYTGPSYKPQQPWIGYDNRNTTYVNQFFGDMTLPAKNPPAPGKIDQYLKNYEIRQCPERPPGWQMVVAYNYWHNCDPLAYCDAYSSYWRRNPKAYMEEYGPGAKLMYNRNGFVETKGVNDSEIQEPSNTVAVWEHGVWAPVCTYLMIYDWFDSPPPDPYNDLKQHFNFVHREGAIMLWCDTHVRRQVFGNLKRPMFSVRKDIYQ